MAKLPRNTPGRRLDGSHAAGKGSRRRRESGQAAQKVAALGERLFWEKGTLSEPEYRALELEWKKAKRDLL